MTNRSIFFLVWAARSQGLIRRGPKGAVLFDDFMCAQFGRRLISPEVKYVIFGLIVVIC